MNLKKHLKIFFCICCVIFGIHLYLEPIYTPTAILTPSKHAYFPKYIAHKALVSGDYTGNTLEAIQESLGSYVDGIEVDVRLSKDGVPFLFHAESLEEATDGIGKPENYTWEELQQLIYNDDQHSKLISLDELLELVGSQKSIFLDIKTDKILNNEFPIKIIEYIRKHHLQESVIVESFNPFFLAAMRLKDRDILLMYDFALNATAMGEEVQSQFDQIPWLLKQPFFQQQVRRIVKPDILGPRYNVDKQMLKSYIDNGYPVITWTVDDPEIAQDLFEMGIKGIQTNKPLQLLQSSSRAQQIVYDAGGTHRRPHEVIHVKNTQDVIEAIEKANKTQRKVTIAGRRHSMGGQTLLDDSIQLNMLGLDQVYYHPEKCTVTVGSGATWKKVQNVLNENGRSVKVMQSDNIFSVGGSLSVNVHGWQVGAPPIASTVLSITIVTSDGKIRHVNADTEPELFRAVLGGYGLFGVVIAAELETVPNLKMKFRAKYMKPEKFVKEFDLNITKNQAVELAYGRLSVDQDSLFEEVGLFWYEKTDQSSSEKIKPESMVRMKRIIFRLSEIFEVGKKLRWKAEKVYANKMSSAGTISRNNAMNTDIHILWPLYGKNKDILHEYFVPKECFCGFLNCLRKNVTDFNMNILNVTVREIRKDDISFLPYAKKDMFAFVCLFSQKQEFADEANMREFTQKVVSEVLEMEGSFYLPYRLHFTRQQLFKAYPEIIDWINFKRKWDPNQIFDSDFFQYICK